jgi:TolA-binding protein
MVPGMGTGIMPNMGQIENRLSTMERQIRKLESRISRLETPFQGSTGQYPSSSLQGEDQKFNYPYQTSMQVM